MGIPILCFPFSNFIKMKRKNRACRNQKWSPLMMTIKTFSNLCDLVKELKTYLAPTSKQQKHIYGTSILWIFFWRKTNHESFRENKNPDAQKNNSISKDVTHQITSFEKPSLILIGNVGKLWLYITISMAIPLIMSISSKYGLVLTCWFIWSMLFITHHRNIQTDH